MTPTLPPPPADAQPPLPPGTPQSQPAKPWWKKRWGIALIVVAALFVIGSISNLSAGGSGDAASPSPTGVAEVSEAPAETEEPTASEEPAPEATTSPEATPDPTPEPTAEATQAPDPIPAPKPTPALTASQRNAIAKAQDYLDYTSFSRSGLIDQLVYEGFTKTVSTFAVDSLKVNWKEQSYLKAQDYLEYSSFSLPSLIDQLEYEGFTKAQAKYGATKAYGE